MLGHAEMMDIWEEFDRREAEEKVQGGNQSGKRAGIHSDKLFKLMDPSKALEVLRRGKVFDVEAQGKRIERCTDQDFKLVGLCQAQTRKVVELCLGQSETALQEGQKFVTQWVSTATQVNSELVKDARANVKEAARAFGLPNLAKAA